jgi:D-alanyl-D-alanine carboxypeptidase/D-alanyl-D-alanine-endopeptidase (penicillin-binding protein 4)
MRRQAGKVCSVATVKREYNPAFAVPEREVVRPGRRFLTALVAALFVFSAGAARAQRKPKPPNERVDVAKFRVRLEKILADAKAERGYWGVLVVDAKSGQTLYALNEKKYFTPASNTKLYTTVAALALLGPQHTFTTRILSYAPADEHGRLMGDLVLVAGGDPNLSNRKFPYTLRVERDGPPEKILATLADRVVQAGVKQIEGDVVVDDSYYPPDRYPSGWAIDDMVASYGAPVSALCLNDNTLSIEVRPACAGCKAWFSVEPWAEFYDFVNEVITGAKDSERRVTMRREPGSRSVVLRGNIPLGGEPQTLALAIEEPAEFAAALLKRLLEARGVRIYGRARAVHAASTHTGEARIYAEHVSLPLMADVRVVNKISQNLHAELLLRAISKKQGDGSVRAGLRALQDFLKTLGIAEDDVALNDGSGLSRGNLITARATVKLLQFAATQTWAAEFMDSLPVSALDGTLDTRMKDTPAAGRIRAKTGSLGNVNALSGFATTVHGTELVFSMFGNAHNLRGRDATGVLDAICVAMIEELGAPEKKKKTK